MFTFVEGRASSAVLLDILSSWSYISRIQGVHPDPQQSVASGRTGSGGSADKDFWTEIGSGGSIDFENCWAEIDSGGSVNEDSWAEIGFSETVDDKDSWAEVGSGGSVDNEDTWAEIGSLELGSIVASLPQYFHKV